MSSTTIVALFAPVLICGIVMAIYFAVQDRKERSNTNHLHHR